MKSIIYIALVTIVLYVEGKRKEIPAGEPLPDGVDQHDIDEMLASKSIEDSTAKEKQAKADAKAGAATQAEFEAEREKLLRGAAANAEASASAVALATKEKAKEEPKTTGKK